jgi:hypothetical protein
MKKAWMVLVMCGVVCFALDVIAAETNYPTRPIEITIGYAPGAGTDLGTRMRGGQDCVNTHCQGKTGRLFAGSHYGFRHYFGAPSGESALQSHGGIYLHQSVRNP